MKPWEELTPLEKQEAIAVRLGWIKLDSIYPTLWLYHSECVEELPDWPTNDGLAFAEVWPKIVVGNSRAPLGMGISIGRLPPIVPLIYDKEFHTIRKGDTWADAICAAAYELLPAIGGIPR